MLVHKSGQAYLLELGYEPKVNSLMVNSHVDIPAQAMLKYLQGQMITKMYFRVLRPQDIPLYPFPIAVIILDAKYYNSFVVVSRKYYIFL